MPIYSFERGVNESSRLLGLKGKGLVQMSAMKLPVPQGFIITTEVCEKFFEAGLRLPDGLMNEVKMAIKELEIQVGLKYGDPNDPLLVSVKGGLSHHVLTRDRFQCTYRKIRLI